MTPAIPDLPSLLRVNEGFVLSSVDTSSTPGYDGGKKSAEADLAAGTDSLDDHQERLYAESRTGSTTDAVLLVLQAMDSAGKGGIIRHVVGSVDPQGVSLTAFKKPTPEDLQHDFLWRIEKHVPAPGIIGVFDRSHYEDVLIGRVRSLADPEEIERRYGAIDDFEQRLVDSGVRVVKIMLHISYAEQGRRLMRRLDRADKQWKFTPNDVAERALWPHYMAAFQTVFERTSTKAAPWYVVPADHKWYARLAVQSLLLSTLRSIDPQWPAPPYDVAEQRAHLAATSTP